MVFCPACRQHLRAQLTPNDAQCMFSSEAVVMSMLKLLIIVIFCQCYLCTIKNFLSTYARNLLSRFETLSFSLNIATLLMRGHRDCELILLPSQRIPSSSTFIGLYQGAGHVRGTIHLSPNHATRSSDRGARMTANPTGTTSRITSSVGTSVTMSTQTTAIFFGYTLNPPTNQRKFSVEFIYTLNVKLISLLTGKADGLNYVDQRSNNL
jgi:hypothetical protein